MDRQYTPRLRCKMRELAVARRAWLAVRVLTGSLLDLDRRETRRRGRIPRRVWELCVTLGGLPSESLKPCQPTTITPRSTLGPHTFQLVVWKSHRFLAGFKVAVMAQVVDIAMKSTGRSYFPRPRPRPFQV